MFSSWILKIKTSSRNIFFLFSCKTHALVYTSTQEEKSIQVQSNLQSRTTQIEPLSSTQHIQKCLCKINQIIWVNWFQAASVTAGGDGITGCLLMKNYSSKLTIPTPVCCICKIPAVVIGIFVEKFKHNFETRQKKKRLYSHMGILAEDLGHWCCNSEKILLNAIWQAMPKMPVVIN